MHREIPEVELALEVVERSVASVATPVCPVSVPTVA